MNADGSALAWAGSDAERKAGGDPGSILARIDPAKVSEEARKESRNREVYLPPLSTFRWWARRTGAVNAAVLAEAAKVLGRETLDVLDPFAGGGTIPLVALQGGHRIQARDINPWAAEGIRRMLELPEPEALEEASQALGEQAQVTLRKAYATTMSDGAPGHLAHTFRVAVAPCTACRTSHRLFPYATLSLLRRRERKRPEAYLACPAGHVFEGREGDLQDCPECGRATDPAAFYTPRRFVLCPECGNEERLSDRVAERPFEWEVVLVERAGAEGREFALPTPAEVRQAQRGWKPQLKLGKIPDGTETKVLTRHGFESWEDLYPDRQRVVTETLLDLAANVTDAPDVAAALWMAIIGTAEFPGLLSRWDRFYLKCNDATAGHRFNFSTFVPELNVWGAGSIGRGTVTRRVRSLCRAAEWIREEEVDEDQATIECGDSGELPNEHDVDLVLTDPPYHDDVHYGELSLLFRGWAGLPMDDLEGEAAVNSAAGLNTDDEAYAGSLARVFAVCHRALRKEGRLVFSFANHEPGAWVALFAALQRAGFHALACVSVHSENETDFKKRGIRSCTDDLLLELSPEPRAQLPLGLFEGEGPFMEAVGNLFLRVGSLEGEWEEEARLDLRAARQDQLAREGRERSERAEQPDDSA